MADAHVPSPRSDRDLASMGEARALARRARAAHLQYAEFSQERIDAVVDAAAGAVAPLAESLAALAVEETGFGVVADKIQKNTFAAVRVHEFVKPLTTVGVIRRDETRKIVEIAEPFGPVAAIIPSTNPTSTAIYKILIALKARCAIVLSPHPSAVRCITRVAEVMSAAAVAAGAPEGTISWMTTVTLEGTQELMRQREIAVILATGGMGLVRAAYSAGKPAYGVGPGNAPCYVDRSADVIKAASDILVGKSFDNGVLCSSPNSVVADAAIAAALEAEFVAQGAYFLAPHENEALARVLVTPQRLPNPALVGKSAMVVAHAAGIAVPADTRALIARLEGVGREHPLSIEKLCPVLSYYVVDGWREGCERCKQILRYGGMGHTMSIHASDEAVILEFGLHKPAFRIIVNSPTTHGSIGLTTGLDPALTLGCGGHGGNITSDNISPMHLLNIKRLAYEVRPAQAPPRRGAGGPATPAPSATTAPPARRGEGIDAARLASRIDEFLATRGIGPMTVAGPPPAQVAPAAQVAPPDPGPAVTFVCEDDVRAAMRASRKIRLAPKAIVTPSARELGDTHQVFE